MKNWLWTLLPVALSLPSAYYTSKAVFEPDFSLREHWFGLAVMLAPPAIVWTLVLYGRWTA